MNNNNNNNSTTTVVEIVHSNQEDENVDASNPVPIPENNDAKEEKEASPEKEESPAPPVRMKRNVSFPDEESLLVTGYLEPINPWENTENVSNDELINFYRSSCKRHGVEPLDKVLEQIKLLNLDCGGRSGCFDLQGETISAIAAECLEEVLKRVQFDKIILESASLEDESAAALFDMVEFYESAVTLNISDNAAIGARGWQACARMIKKTSCLEQLEAREVTLNDIYMPQLARALRLSTIPLQVLHLEKCSLTGRPLLLLIGALRLNTTLRELYLADNSLTSHDSLHLGGLLRANRIIQLLDVSNNLLADEGTREICKGLSEQIVTPSQLSQPGGLAILVLWNNHLTEEAARHLASALRSSKSLCILNVGQNELRDDGILELKEAMQQNRTLLRLGIQATQITCQGAISVAEWVADNPTIQRIDLRDNNINLAGLMALARSMKVNTSVTRLDLDDEPKTKKHTISDYTALVSEIRGYCTRNQKAAEEKEAMAAAAAEVNPDKESLDSAHSLFTSRKISLTCETLLKTNKHNNNSNNNNANQFLMEPKRSGRKLRSPAPSPVPSPVSSPLPSPSRHRFQVLRVPEDDSSSPPTPLSSSYSPPNVPSRFFPPSPVTSRFRVTPVPDPHKIMTSTNSTLSKDGLFISSSPFVSPNRLSVSSDNSDVSDVFEPLQSPLSSPSSPIAPLIVPTPASCTLSNPILIEEQSIVTEKVITESKTLISENNHSTFVETNKPTPEKTSPCPQSNVVESKNTLEKTINIQTSSLIKMPVINRKISEPISIPSPTSQLISDFKESTLTKITRKISEPILNKVTTTPSPTTTVTSQSTTNPRTRKLSWIAPAQLQGDENKPSSHLEKLLGLFNPFRSIPTTSTTTLSTSTPSTSSSTNITTRTTPNLLNNNNINETRNELEDTTTSSITTTTSTTLST